MHLCVICWLRIGGKKEPRSEFAARPSDRMDRCYAKPQRLQGWSVGGRRHGHTVVSLISCQRPACLRTKISIDRSRIISLFLQCDLDVHDDPIWGQIAIAVN